MWFTESSVDLALVFEICLIFVSRRQVQSSLHVCCCHKQVMLRTSKIMPVNGINAGESIRQVFGVVYLATMCRRQPESRKDTGSIV